MKHLLILLSLLLLAYLLSWNTQQGGSVVITWQDWQIETSPTLLLVGVLLGGLVLFLLLESLMLAATLPAKIRRAHAARQQRSGLDALGQGMAALALGDHDAASREIARGCVLLKEHPASLMLASQLAHRRGDTQEVEAMLLKLRSHPATQAVAARGLWQISLGRGDWSEARRQAEALLRTHPRDKGTRVQLLGILLHQGDWSGAEALIRNAALRRRFTSAERKHLRAMAAYLQARPMPEHGPARLELLKKAHSLDPTFIAGSLLYARDLAEMGKVKEAENVLRKAWLAFQHPDIADAWHRLQLDTPIEKRNARLLAFVKGTETSAETHIWLAQHYLNTGDVTRARSHAEAVREDIRAERLMASLHATAPAAGAPPLAAPTWLCGNCHVHHAQWLAWCARCRLFDSVSWRRPPSDSHLQEIVTSAA